MEINIRPFELGDKHFLYATILRGIYYGNEFYAQIDQEAYFQAYQLVLDNLFNKNGVVVRIACLPEDTSVILGFAVLEQGVLHYVYVKDAFRKQGLARQLVAGTEISSVTHITKPGNAIRKKQRWAFNPFLL